MNSYLIQKRILTPSHNYLDVECQGYVFRAREPETPWKDGLLAEETVEASTFREAYTAFATGLLPLLNLISVLTQCEVTSGHLGSFLVYKTNANSEQICFFRHVRRSDAVGIDFDDTAARDIGKLVEEDQTPYEYLREANSATTSTHFLSALISAAEAFAGQGKVTAQCGKCGREVVCEHCGKPHTYVGTDRDELKEVLGPELYRDLYVRDGQRHKLLHGRGIDGAKVSGLGRRLHDRLLFGYLQPKYKLESIHRIVGAPRVFGANFEAGGMFLRPKAKFVPDLALLEVQAESLKDFRIVSEPASY